MGEDITGSEILQAIEDAMQQTETSRAEGLTLNELEEATGLSKYRLRKLIRLLFDMNRVEVSKVQRKTIAGAFFPVPAYKMRGDAE